LSKKRFDLAGDANGLLGREKEGAGKVGCTGGVRSNALNMVFALQKGRFEQRSGILLEKKRELKERPSTSFGGLSSIEVGLLEGMFT